MAGLPFEVLGDPKANRFPHADSPIASRKSMLNLLRDDIPIEEVLRAIFELSELLINGLRFLELDLDRLHEEKLEGGDKELHHEVTSHFDPLLAEVVTILLLFIVEVGED